MASGKSTQRDTTQQSRNPDDVAAELGTAASEAGGSVQAAASELTQSFQQRITSQVTAQQERAVDTLQTVALLLQQAGEHARKEDKAGIAQYADQAAEQVERLTTAIRDREPEQLLADARQLAQQRPGVFLGGALLAGFLGSRFLRASAQQRSGGEQDTEQQPATDHDSAPGGHEPLAGDGLGESGFTADNLDTAGGAVPGATGTDLGEDIYLEEDTATLTDLADEALVEGREGTLGDAGADLSDTERL